MQKINIQVKGIDLTATQKSIYIAATDDSCKFLTCNISRRQGKTTMCQLLALQWLFQSRINVGYVTPTFKLGKKIFEDIANRLPKDVIKSIDRSNLTLSTNIESNLLFYSGEAPENMRGFGFNYFIVDEQAFIPEVKSGQNVWQEIIRPTLRDAKKVILISTPCTTDGFFYDCYRKGQKNNPGYKTIEQDIYHDGLITKNELYTLKRELHPRFFAREFLVQFNNTDGALFETNLLKTPAAPHPDKWGGIDFSTSGEDETIFTTVDGNGNINQYVIKGDLQAKYRKITDLIRENKVHLTYAESNSIGAPMIDSLKILLLDTSFKIKPFNTSNQSKKEYVELLMDGVQQGQLATTDKDLISQLNTFEQKITASRNVTYAARQGYHDDRVISLALAWKNKYDNRRKKFQIITT